MRTIRVVSTLIFTMASFIYAGGDFTEPTKYEIEDFVEAEEVYIEPEPPKEPVSVKPVPVASPMVIKQKKIKPNGFYAGLGITGVQYGSDCKDVSSSTRVEDRTYGAVARVGYDFNEFIGIEARGSKTNWNSNGSKVTHGGIYIKPMIPVTDSSNLYGLVGLAKTKVTGTLGSVDSEGLALGAGIEVDLSKDNPKNGKYAREFNGRGDQERGVGLFMDYERMVVKSDAPDLDAVSAGVTYDF
jgi:OOP family OmpA-OmpF porin